ncbi:MAG TPA: 6-hydroxymethylpterin diphosphokinase MptE-like protein [Bacteroidia bacterium]|nr:6-hydroxymethylpterin diphosphokinase MptE-like protein [Bacteroidia bacterium]
MISKFNVKLPKAASSSCIILGNGPSLKDSLQHHPAIFKKHELVCVDLFALADEYATIRPTYYVLLDPIFMGEAEDVKRMTAELLKKTTWPLHLLVPQKARTSYLVRTIEKENSSIHIHYFNYTVFKGFSSIAHFFYKHNLAAAQSQNVLVISIFLSINIGFKNIYLVGADHTWHDNLHVNEANQVCVKDAHFYENEQTISYRLFYTNAKKERTFTMAEILTLLGKTFSGYEYLKKYADYRRVNICNCSGISFIDTFERKKLEDIG